MNKNFLDIEDNEIRIITSLKNKKLEIVHKECRVGLVADKSLACNSLDIDRRVARARKRRRVLRTVIVLVCLAALCVGAFLLFRTSDTAQDAVKPVPVASKPLVESAPVKSEPSFTVCTDTVVNGVKLKLLTPRNATPSLEIGNDVTNDASVTLAVQAADVRGDNGEITGVFVVKGNVVSKGTPKSGFCSIINNEICIGVADATPKLEEALTSGGYFFRHYPLVVGGQIVENKPQGKALRKALAETDNGFSVVISEDALTYHDFSQALVDLGVRNAISLVGGNSLTCYTDADSRRFTMGKRWAEKMKFENYIVWR